MPSVLKNRTISVYMICSEISGNGAGTGTFPTKMSNRKIRTAQKQQISMQTASVAAAHGTQNRQTARLISETAAALPRGTVLSVCALSAPAANKTPRFGSLYLID